MTLKVKKNFFKSTESLKDKKKKTVAEFKEIKKSALVITHLTKVTSIKKCITIIKKFHGNA